MIVIVEIDGVLTAGEGRLFERERLAQGVAVTRGLAAECSLVYVSAEPEELVTRWLKLNGAGEPRLVWPAQDVPTVEARIAAARTMGYLGLYLTADPLCAAEALRQSVPTLLLAQPGVVQPEWVPDNPARGYSSWDEVKNEVYRQRELATAEVTTTGAGAYDEG